MMYQRPNYYDIENWIILDTRIIHMYNDDETPIPIFKVKIGTLDIEEVDINSHYNQKNFDIIRWITKVEFDRLIHGAGIIIW